PPNRAQSKLGRRSSGGLFLDTEDTETQRTQRRRLSNLFCFAYTPLEGIEGSLRQGITPRRLAIATAWVRLCASSLVLMLRRCVRIVLSETNSFSAIALFE